MFNVADYLKKFVRLEGDSRQTRDSVQGIFKEVCGIDNVDFDLKKGILYIKGGSMLKSAVFMKKAALIERLSAANPRSRITDIR